MTSPSSDLSRALELPVRGEGCVRFFTPLLQGGFIVTCTTGVPLESLLTVEFGIEQDYIEQRLATVFLDGQCVDSLSGAVVDQCGTLALSSAMPGVAGATLRRGSIYSAMRASITHSGVHPPVTGGTPGFIKVKLFNVVALELGPLFLERGIYVTGRDLANFLELHGTCLEPLCSPAGDSPGGTCWDEIRTIVDGEAPLFIHVRLLRA